MCLYPSLFVRDPIPRWYAGAKMTGLAEPVSRCVTSNPPEWHANQRLSCLTACAQRLRRDAWKQKLILRGSFTFSLHRKTGVPVLSRSLGASSSPHAGTSI